jgi:hypothetical protein
MAVFAFLRIGFSFALVSAGLVAWWPKAGFYQHVGVLMRRAKTGELLVDGTHGVATCEFGEISKDVPGAGIVQMRGTAA